MKLDFSGKSTQHSNRVPNYLVGRDRRHLGYWVFGIGLLIILAFRFGDVLELTSALAKNRDRAPIDTRAPLPAYREPLPHGAVAMPLDETDREPADASAMSPPEKSAREQPSANPPVKSEPLPGNEFERHAAAQKVSDPGYAPGVDVELLKTIKEKSPFREEESQAWYHLFDVVLRADEQALAKQATTIKTFRSIYEQSNYYRGRPITLQGEARWYREHKADADNAAGITSFFEIGLRIEGENDPIFIYCAELPAEWPRGKTDPADPQRYLLKQPIRVTGVGYKNFGYSATDTLRYAPLVIAKTVQVLPTAQPAKRLSLGDIGWPAVMLIAGMIVMLPLLWITFGKKRTGFTLVDPSPRIQPPADFQESEIRIDPPADR